MRGLEQRETGQFLKSDYGAENSPESNRLGGHSGFQSAPSFVQVPGEFGGAVFPGVGGAYC
jgi:hypothetical protein